VHNIQPTTDIEVEAEKENNIMLWVTLPNAQSRNHGMGWHAGYLYVNCKASWEKFEEKFLLEDVSLKATLQA
jgi:hypothetical protein